MGAVKNHFHDEICGREIEARDDLDTIATSLQADYDKAIFRLSALEAAALRLNGFAGHDDDCALNRFAASDACSCGYTAAYRLLLETLGQ